MRVKKLIKAGRRYISDPYYRFLINMGRGKYSSAADEECLRNVYFAAMHKKLNIQNPTTFNEKLQWLKLYDRNLSYTTLVDKIAVKDYVSSTIGEKYIIPTIGVWNSPDEIDFNKLPDKFVLKCNHNSGLGICVYVKTRQIWILKR